MLRETSEGYSIAEIAARFHLAEGTVHNHLSDATQKTRTRTRIRHQPARYAREHDRLWAAVAAPRRSGDRRGAAAASGPDAPSPIRPGTPARRRAPGRAGEPLRSRTGPPAGQWLPVSSPVRVVWMRALCSLRPTISTVLRRAAYLVVIASRAATVEASQMWARVRSMTTWSGSPA
ncbi:Response regulator containing a CheY-like receiver domain and an HTH DNA-binding domain [Marinactinospora thermotolerans DSM 45154]|uniref:Response regulator containing a CheY-like receiver domain and an HTH DNA-binding domain n=1 Tax=Marinactinospora thermotolerans DSM 45154 TaxID=1122192 RepID=A0A1T4PFH8_9ACTN|nr:Response regulator containing a CheY-like receiver domain and an HTH DNA-binding domain [Marinactinospora thermotolerans DSM 45154]